MLFSAEFFIEPSSTVFQHLSLSAAQHYHSVKVAVRKCFYYTLKENTVKQSEGRKGKVEKFAMDIDPRNQSTVSCACTHHNFIFLSLNTTLILKEGEREEEKVEE